MPRERGIALSLLRRKGLSSFREVRAVLELGGIFSSLYSDRDSRYWKTLVAEERVDKENPTQFGGAMAEFGVVMIPGCSPERSERVFATLQGRLCAETSELGITEMEEANGFLRDKFVADFLRATPCEADVNKEKYWTVPFAINNILSAPRHCGILGKAGQECRFDLRVEGALSAD